MDVEADWESYLRNILRLLVLKDLMLDGTSVMLKSIAQAVPLL